VDRFGGCDSMEGIGNAFVILCGVADEARTTSVLERQFTKHGVPPPLRV
jgi:hypothetical protein